MSLQYQAYIQGLVDQEQAAHDCDGHVCGQASARGIVWADVLADIAAYERNRQIIRDNEGRFWST